MVITEMAQEKKGSFALRPAALAAMAMLASQAVPALAADWLFTPRLTVRETYSDNVTLAPRGAERSDFVTEVAPSFTLTGTGRRAQFSADYTAREVMYARGTGASNLQNYLNAQGRAELKDDLLFIDGRASISNLSASAFGPQVTDSIYATNNRTEVRTYTISPFLRKRFENLADVEARYAHDGVSGDTSGFATYNNDRISLNANSGAAFRKVTWRGVYVRQHSSYSDIDTVNSDYLNGSARYSLTDQFGLTGALGYERYTYNATGDNPRGASYMLGFAWQPSPRTSLEASAGHRFYGAAYALAATHRSRYTVWNIQYNEDITTTQAQLGTPTSISTSAFLNQLFLPNIPDNAARAQAVDAYIRATGLPTSLILSNGGLSNRFYLQKRLQASVGLNTAKSTVLFSAYNVQRRPQTASQNNNALLGNNSLLFADDTRQSGVSALWNWRIAPLTSVNVNAQYYQINALSFDRTDTNRLVSVGLSRQLSPKVSGTVEVRRNQGNYGGIGNYRENALSAYLTMQL